MDMRADETIRKAVVGKYDKKSWLSSPESLRLLKRATISHAIAIAPEIFQSVGIRKKTASTPNISEPNSKGMTTLEPICYKILGV